MTLRAAPHHIGRAGRFPRHSPPKERFKNKHFGWGELYVSPLQQLHHPQHPPPGQTRDAIHHPLARYLSVSRQSVNELLKERRALSPTMAIRLSRLFGNSPEFWLNAQRAVDLWDAAQAIEEEVSRIKPLAAA